MSAPVSYEDLLGLGLSPRSAYYYARIIDDAVRFFDERGTDLATCRPADVAAFAQTIKNTYSMRTMCRSSLKAAWTVLDRYDGPLRAVRVPPRPRMRCRALPETVAAQLERAAWERGDERGLAVLFGLYSALRRFEIAGLRWENFELDERGRPEWIRVRGKGDVIAEIPVHPVLAEALVPVMRRTGWVFPGRVTKSRRDPHVSAATIWNYVREVAEDAGLGQVKTHVLRHTALAEANDRSEDLRGTQEFARHARPEQTAGYTRVQAIRLKRLVSMIDYGRPLPSESVA